MQTIFLAAGRGLRMGSLTDRVPKALLTLSSGRSILETNLLNLQRSGLDSDVVVVGGYGWDAVRDFCDANETDRAVVPVFNPDHATAGPVCSIAAALGALPEGTDAIAVANGDTVFSASMLAALGREPDGISLAVSRDDGIEPDEMGVSLDGTGFVVAATKSAHAQRAGLVSAGLLLVRGAPASAALRAAIRVLIAEEQRAGKFLPWHDLMPFITSAGVPIRQLLVERTDWHEFDHAECLARYTGT